MPAVTLLLQIIGITTPNRAQRAVWRSCCGTDTTPATGGQSRASVGRRSAPRQSTGPHQQVSPCVFGVGQPSRLTAHSPLSVPFVCTAGKEDPRMSPLRVRACSQTCAGFSVIRIRPSAPVCATFSATCAGTVHIFIQVGVPLPRLTMTLDASCSKRSLGCACLCPRSSGAARHHRAPH